MMLSSQNPDDVMLAAGIIATETGGPEFSKSINQIIVKLMDVGLTTYSKIHNSDKWKQASIAVDEAITKLSRETWIDPITTLAERATEDRALGPLNEEIDQAL